ncbi:MAG TPA: hypothetical protein VFU21_07430 [Kofleriaceae bacterium]|nr:hypothetical protein [Kofleriaceae bacterium]
MSAPLRLEAFLARLYTDAEARAAFVADPLGAARAAGVAPADAARLAAIDRADLELAAASVASKRQRRGA